MSSLQGQGPPPPVDGLVDYSATIRNMLIAFMILPTIAVAVRFWSRVLIKRDRSGSYGRLWWDDWTCLGSLCVTLTMNAIGLRLIELGLGKKVAVVQPTKEEVSEFLMLFWVNSLLWPLAFTFARSSAILFYHRIFDVSRDWFHWTLVITLILSWAWWIGTWVSIILECKPIAKSWEPEMPGTCSSDGTEYLAQCVPGFVLDFVILILPVPKIWILRVPKLQKVQLSILFFLAYGVVVDSIGKTVSLVQTGSSFASDVTFNTTNFLFWLIPATPLGIVCICLPEVVFLFRRAYNHSFASSSRTKLETARGPSDEAQKFSRLRSQPSVDNGTYFNEMRLHKHGSHRTEVEGHASDMIFEDRSRYNTSHIYIKQEFSVERRTSG